MLKNNKFNIFAILILTALVSISEIQGHGMMLDPVSRSSRWRYNKSAPINYDDNGLFCGGFGVQWNQNKGRCGLCGDDFAAPKPRPNEIGGKYGQGVITKAYPQSQNAQLGIKITTNHLGFFYFNICNLDKFKVESEECFSARKVKFSDGSTKMYIGKKAGMIYPTIVLPKGLTCKHCVLRWNYQAGNNWGPCGNGTSAIGCGPQENFKGCSDISITKKSRRSKTNGKKNLFTKILNRNNNFGYDNIAPRGELYPHQLLDNYFYESSKGNNFYNILFEFGNDEKTLLGFDKNVNNDIDDIIDESKQEDKSVPVFVQYPFYKEEDGAFDREVLDMADYILFDSKMQKIAKSFPGYAKADQSEKKIIPDLDTLNDLYVFGEEELANNALDDNFDDLDDV